jgi:hypothetical protein
MAAWGIVSACTAASRNFGDLVATRFILGMVEAAFCKRFITIETSGGARRRWRNPLLTSPLISHRSVPGALYYLSLFYTRKAFATRVAFLYAGSQLGNAFGGKPLPSKLTLD